MSKRRLILYGADPKASPNVSLKMSSEFNNMFFNKYNHIKNISSFRTLPFPAMITLLVGQFFVQNITKGMKI